MPQDTHQSFASDSVLESTKFVVEHAQHVSIDQKELERYVDNLQIAELKPWLLAGPADISAFTQMELLNFIFVFSSLSFSYWGPPDYFFEYKGKKYMTSWGLDVALYAAYENKLPILNLQYLSKISDEELNKIINKDVEIPIFSERCRILRENCEIICRNFDGSLARMIETANHDAAKLLGDIYVTFPAFRDEATYKGKKVYFMKKAQIFIGDISRMLKPPLGNLKNVSSLTAAADYRLPQLLREIMILHYSEELSALVDSEKQILPGSPYEVEIRATTIWAVEYMRRYLFKKEKVLNAIDINDYLWLDAKQKAAVARPFHRVRTTMY